MRSLLALLLWLLTTALLAVSIPALWTQHHVVSVDGYSDLAAGAARNPALQQPMAAELTEQVVNATGASGVQATLIGAAANSYTGSSVFPGQFAAVNRVAHRWLFTNDAQGRWEVDLSPMLADNSIRQTLDGFGVQAPTSLQVPVTENESGGLRPGQLRPVAVWGPWASVGAAVLTVVFALLTLTASRRRGKMIAALGVSGLLVGAAGWAGIEIGRGYVDDALSRTTGNIHAIADVMVDHAVASMHMWLNLTLTVGGGLVIIGVIVSLLSGLGRSRTEEVPATRKR
ncbi:hypothetical protein [Mycolicibacterium diernhoferi]|uniref:Uncharacterized protein n=1 Tax=Mycolicibacterium diernhoferi TaxID=1801 RepID=A0A1Q4H456_9MYCO|nr:hypothetical protein [Mycolicibacterium diernhoferi]OJZ61653.1 hypothetical protein BRW64_27490 [Mycolicibacterium diernhoferi]OPE54100.1 hypothetical protein BV510_12155 [Mycolicibacterium diernhoferi]PEG51171.1 hypothetical protein CRI78_28035 [Mycolicibacterium diernhoferi]QYL23521.1 hypothetical protein K0O62_04080 [Mycolicibacterium diernhoferi]